MEGEGEELTNMLVKHVPHLHIKLKRTHALETKKKKPRPKKIPIKTRPLKRPWHVAPRVHIATWREISGWEYGSKSAIMDRRCGPNYQTERKPPNCRPRPASCHR